MHRRLFAAAFALAAGVAIAILGAWAMQAHPDATSPRLGGSWPDLQGALAMQQAYWMPLPGLGFSGIAIWGTLAAAAALAAAGPHKARAAWGLGAFAVLAFAGSTVTPQAYVFEPWAAVLGGAALAWAMSRVFAPWRAAVVTFGIAGIGVLVGCDLAHAALEWGNVAQAYADSGRVTVVGGAGWQDALVVVPAAAALGAGALGVALPKRAPKAKPAAKPAA